MSAEATDLILKTLYNLITCLESGDMLVEAYSFEQEAIFSGLLGNMTPIRSGPRWKLSVELYDFRNAPRRLEEFSTWK